MDDEGKDERLKKEWNIKMCCVGMDADDALMEMLDSR
jgi:hypothetical protein